LGVEARVSQRHSIFSRISSAEKKYAYEPCPASNVA
jgi:hypothetical protein